MGFANRRRSWTDIEASFVQLEGKFNAQVAWKGDKYRQKGNVSTRLSCMIS